MIKTSHTDNEFVDPLENFEPAVYADPLERSLAETTVGSLQIQPSVAIPADMTVAEAVRKLVGDDVACVMVEQDGRLAGVFSDRDVLDRVALELDARQGGPVRDVMTSAPVAVRETDSVSAALAVMAVSGFRHVPVVNADDRPVGIVSPRRMARFLRQRFAETADSEEKKL